MNRIRANQVKVHFAAHYVQCDRHGIIAEDLTQKFYFEVTFLMGQPPPNTLVSSVSLLPSLPAPGDGNKRDPGNEVAAGNPSFHVLLSKTVPANSYLAQLPRNI